METRKRSTHDVALLVANTNADSEEIGASKKLDNIEKAVTPMMAPMHGITPQQTLPGGGLGPTPTCQVQLEGVPFWTQDPPSASSPWNSFSR